jgi:hypothetical protein
MPGDGENSWGLGHLAGLPITLTFGMVLLGALILLIVLRLAFANVSAGIK